MNIKKFERFIDDSFSSANIWVVIPITIIIIIMVMLSIFFLIAFPIVIIPVFIGGSICSLYLSYRKWDRDQQ